VRVVIAEDLFLLRDGLTRMLQAHGLEIVAAVDNGADLLAAVTAEKPDVAIVDVRLPPTFTDEGIRAALAATIRVMDPQRFRAVIAADPGGRAVIVVPFDPDETWGAKANHPVGGTIDGRRIRGRLSPGGGRWVLPVRLQAGAEIGDDVSVELAPEGPQRGDLADDIAAALAANPAAGAFFDTLAQFYRKAYLRWIDATTRRPDVRAARIAEVVGLLAAGIKERPRS
jgi:CheY-like chemotaxis protein